MVTKPGDITSPSTRSGEEIWQNDPMQFSNRTGLEERAPRGSFSPKTLIVRCKLVHK
jgi:hypothetical protein